MNKPSLSDLTTIRLFEASDISMIVNTFSEHHWFKPAETFETYWKEQLLDERLMWLAFVKQQFAGYVTLKWQSKYAHFFKNQIPEIMDLNVLPPYRREGIGLRLLKTAENAARSKADVVGLGVGLYADYGSAQRLYVKQGYVPDGFGITYDYKPIEPGNSVILDDDLVLWFTKKFI